MDEKIRKALFDSTVHNLGEMCFAVAERDRNLTATYLDQLAQRLTNMASRERQNAKGGY